MHHKLETVVALWCFRFITIRMDRNQRHKLSSFVAMLIFSQGFQGLLSCWIEQRQQGKDFHHQARDDDHFVVDMDKDLYKYKVRDSDYHRYGGIVFYNKERKVNRILFRKGNSAFIIITCRETQIFAH